MNRRKHVIIFGAVAVVLVMMSSAIAVPNVESGAVMSSLEQERVEAITELVNLCNEILYDENFDINELQENYDFDPTQGFEDLFDIDGFLNFIVSDEFIDTLKDKFDDLLSFDAVLFLFNTNAMQEYVNSDEFMYFVNTDELQYILDKLNEEDNQEEFSTVSTVENVAELQCVSMGVQQNCPMVLENYLETDLVFCIAEELEIETSSDFPFLEAFIVFLVAIILWLPVICMMLISSPLFFLLQFIAYESLFFGVPGGTIATAIVAFFITVIAVIVICGLWPFLAVYMYLDPLYG